jgi:hypothetical protein
LTKRDCHTLRRIVSKSDRTTAQCRWQQNWIFIWKTLFPQKLSDVSFINPTSMLGLQLQNLWLLKLMLRCLNNDVTTINLDIRQLEACTSYGQMSRPWHFSLCEEEFMFWEHKPTIRNAWFQQWNTGEVLWWFGQ